MKRVKIIVAFIVISLAVVSCKAPCGCNGRGGFGEIKSVDHQIEQRT
jgi:ABC-type methionine transport system permease subunit